MVVGRDSQKAQETVAALGEASFPVVADAAEPDTARRSVEAALEHFGGFDALYHVAGGSGRAAGDGPIDGISNEGWNFTIAMNLTSAFYSNRAAAEQFIRQGSGGSVLNMSSVLAFSPAPRHFATHAYAAAKAGVIGLTKACAAYYAGQKIRFNAIAPGLVETPMSKRAAADPEIMSYLATRQPLAGGDTEGGNMGQPADLDDAVVFFLSPASRLVTGQVLAVDGGWSVSEGQFRDP